MADGVVCIKDEVINLACQKSSLSILNAYAAGFLCTYFRTTFYAQVYRFHPLRINCELAESGM